MKTFFKKIIASILQYEAQIILKKYHPRIIAITGSVGKTSTKDAIYTVLADSSHVRKSEKSFNSEIGVPLTILGVQNGWSNPITWIQNIFHGLELIFFKVKYPDTLVLEVGADGPGDIQRVSKWLKADIVLINKISDVPVHVEFFPSVEALVKEKASLINALKKEGTLVLFADDAKVMKLSEGRVQADGVKQKVVTFGVTSPATITASHDMIVYEGGVPVGMSFKLNYSGSSVPVVLRGVLGAHHMYPILAGAMVGIERGVLLTDIVSRLTAHSAPRGRMNIIPGIRGSTIIDDTYNSSPDAVHEALNTLEKLETTGKKIAILGDMMELGKFSTEEHKKVGEHAKKVASIVISVGQRSAHMPLVTKSFDTSYDSLEYVKSVLGQGDIVLVKGSQSVRMERIVKALMAEPEKAEKLLVRQEREWLAKK